MINRLFGSIRRRVLVLFVFIVLTITIAIMTLTGLFSRSLVNNLVEQNAFDLVQSHAQIVQLWQEERIQELKQLANSSLLESLDWDSIEPFLQRQIKDSDEYYLIFFVATPDGDYNTTRQRSAGNISDRNYFLKAMAGKTAISEPLISRSTGKRIVAMATPIWDENNSSVIGVLGLSVSLVEVYESIANLKTTGHDHNTFLVDDDGFFLTHYDPSLIMQTRIQDYYPAWDTLAQEQSGSLTYQVNGEEFRAFFAKVMTPEGWNVIKQIPTSYFAEPVKKLLYYLLAVGIVGIILVLKLGSWFASMITEPIVELKEIFRQGSEGDLTVRAEVASIDEFGDTRASFNRMMDTIGTMTYYDPLTNLPNRHSFLDHLGTCLTEYQTVILTLVSVRGLSELKTLLGPEVTDKILVRLANILKPINTNEVLVARVADAEFGITIPSTISGVLQVIDKLDNLLNTSLHIEESDLQIHLIGGLTISEKDDLSAESFYQQAQTALYEAEHSVNEQIKLYNPSTHHAIVDRLRFQSEIHTALKQEQFVVFYQPIIDLKTFRIVGKEALIRWEHPVRGLLAPSEFLEIAEQGGFIEEIGEYMLAKVCDQHHRWRDQELNLGWVAVNISANHFRDPNFPSLVQSILKNHGANSDVLRIEITEDAMLSPTPEVLNNLKELHKMGVRVAIDDFGTAYSTLEYLARYPMETLKIDKTFIDHVDDDSRTQGLVRSIIGMGQNLSMVVVAEGVERREQLDILREMGCTEAQGYLFSRPVPWQDYPQLVIDLTKRLKQDDFL